MAKSKNKSKNKKNVDVVDSAEADIAEVQVETERTMLAAQKSAVAAEMRDKVEELRTTESATSLEVRVIWIEIGNMMLTGRELFRKDNGNVDNMAFGNWMRDEKMDQNVMDRNKRTHAMWLASVYNDNQDLYNLIPSEGTDVKRSPTTIQRWYKEQLKTLFQLASENDIGVEKEADAETVSAGVTNLFEWANDHAPDMAEDKREAFILSVELAKATSADDLGSEFLKFKPKATAVSFAERDIDDAAAYLLKLLTTHNEAIAVYEAMKEPLDAAIASLIEEDIEDDDIEEDDIEEDDIEEDDIEEDDIEEDDDI